jgi:hypothetical protein
MTKTEVFMRRNVIGSTFLTVTLSMAAFSLGCSDDDTSGTTTTNTTDSGGGGGTDTGTDAGTTTLYARLGGHDGITTAITAIVAEELKDTEIAAFFGNVGKTGHPTKDQVIACFTDLLGHAAGGTELYPATESGFTCRDMKTSHTGMNIPAATFDKFVTIAAGVLKTAGVADADIGTIGGVLNGTKADIVGM